MTENKSVEACRLFEGEFERAVKHDNVVDIIQMCDDTCSSEDIKRSGKRTLNTHENKSVVKNAFTQSLTSTKSARPAC